MKRIVSGYCNYYGENRTISIDFLPVAMGHSLEKSYKKDSFTACSDCPLSNNIITGDICPIYRSASSLRE